MSLRDKAKSLNTEGFDFMETRTKGEFKDLAKQVVNIMDFGVVHSKGEHGEDAEYILFITDSEETGEDGKKLFYVAGGVAIVEKFKEIASDEKDMEELRKDGLPCLFDQRPSKVKGRNPYWTVEFYPEG